MPGRAVTVEIEVDGCTDEVVSVALWRDADGSVVAIDDRCPHQWSSLGEVGVVDGPELMCTAHGWRFDSDGAACKVGMSGRRDAKGRTRTWPCREADGHVWVEVAAGR